MIKNRSKAFMAALATILFIMGPIATTNVSAMNNQQKAAIQKSSTIKMKVINTSSLEVKKSASTKSEKLGSIKKGQTVEVISISKGFAKISFKGKYGYVNSKYLEEVKTSTVSQSKYKEREMHVTKSGSLTVRKGAGTKYASIGKVKNGDVVIAVQELSNGWVKIQYKNSYGYVPSSDLKKGVYVEDRKASNNVISKIKNLGSNVKLSDKDKVVNARKAYNSLSQSAKKLVTNLSVLEKAESRIAKLEAEQKSANSVVSKIKGLKKNITLSDKGAIEEIRGEYNKLSSSAKKLVTNLNVLEEAEFKITALEKERENKLNQMNADRVIAQINELNKQISLNDESIVKSARKAYDDLNKPSKVLVTNLHILEKAESKIAEIKKEEETARLNKANAERVMDQINKLNKTITLDDTDAINSTRKSYNNLNSKAKLLVTNLDVLEKAESTFDEIRSVIRLMNKLPVNIELSHKEQVQEVRRAFESLSKEAQDSIPDIQLAILTTAELKIVEIERENSDSLIAKDLVERIKNLDKVIEYTDAKEINQIRAAYDGLVYPAKQKVTNYDDFMSAEEQLNDVYCDIIYVEHLIKELPSDITLECKDAVKEAYDKYNALSDNNKIGVDGNLVEKLNSAVNTLKSLQ